MKRLFCACLPVLTFLNPVAAQTAPYADLLTNADITWVAEYTSDFTLQPQVYGGYGFESTINEVSVMQLSDAPPDNGLFARQRLEAYFSRKIMGDIRKGVFSFYEDELLETPLSLEKALERMVRLDTVVTFDPEMYEEKVNISVNNIDEDDVATFRFRQVFFFNKQDRTFGSRLLAFAPLIARFNIEGDPAEPRVLFWLKVEVPKNATRVVPADVTYACETKMRGNAPLLGDFRLKKGRLDFLQYVANEVAQPSHPVLDPNFQPIGPASLQEFVIRPDTVVDYQAYSGSEEPVKIIQRNVIAHIVSVSFVQHWFYDDRKRLFFNRVVAMAPELAVKDDLDNLVSREVLFYVLNIK